MSELKGLLGSEGISIRDILEEKFTNPEFDINISSDQDFNEIVSLYQNLSKSVENIEDLFGNGFDSVSKILVETLKFETGLEKIRNSSDERRDKISQKIADLNSDHYKKIESLEKRKEKIEKDKVRSLKDLGDGDSATRKLLQIQEKNPISRIFKTGLFDFRKGISDSIKSAPILGEFDLFKNIASSINPETQSEKDIERLVEVGKEIEEIENSIKKVGGESTKQGAIFAEELKKLKSEESEIVGRTGSPVSEVAELNKIEQQKLQLELLSQTNILEEIRDALESETDEKLIEDLKDQEKKSSEKRDEILNKIQENLDKQNQTQQQEDLIAAQKLAASSKPSDLSKLKDAKVESDESKSGFLDGLLGMFGPDGNKSKIMKELSKKIGLFFASIATALKGVLVAAKAILLPVALVSLIVYSIKEAFDEMFEVFDSKGSIVESLKAGMSRFVGTLLGFPLDLLKSVISYVAEWMGFEDFSKYLDSFSFADIITEFYFKFLDYVESAVLGVNDFIEYLFGVDILGALGEFFDIFNWDVIMADLKASWKSFKSEVSVVGKDLKSWIKTKWEDLKISLSTSWETFKKTFLELWGGLSTWFKGKWTGLKTSLGEKWEEIKKNFGLDEIISSIMDKVKSVFDIVSDKISSMVNSVLGFLPDSWIKKSPESTETSPIAGENGKKPKLTNEQLSQAKSDFASAIDSGDLKEASKILRSEISGNVSDEEFGKMQDVWRRAFSNFKNKQIQNSTPTPSRMETAEQLKSSEQTKKDIDNKMKSGQGEGSYQQTNVRTGDRTSITTINKTPQNQPLGRKPVAID